MIPADEIREVIEEQADLIGLVWPMHSFVTANPLAGLEDRSFHEAVERGSRVLGGRAYPSAEVFERAWNRGAIDRGKLEARLRSIDPKWSAESSLERMREGAHDETPSAPEEWESLDRILTDWLAAFLDEGGAEWSMPGRERGFYGAVRQLAPHDPDVPEMNHPSDWPEDPLEALRSILAEVTADRREVVVREHFAALSGWVGFIRRRLRDEGPWHQEYPMRLEGYLAVRLLVGEQIGAPIDPTPVGDAGSGPRRRGLQRLQRAWLEAWEETYRDELLEGLSDGPPESNSSMDRPDARLVFCIDTRSEVIRRHLEARGNYMTDGFAGFFGIPMRYRGYDSEIDVDACPPIVDAAHRIEDRPDGDHEERRCQRDFWTNLWQTGKRVIDSLKSNPATAFSFVESAGALYGGLLAGRTLWPQALREARIRATKGVSGDHEFCRPALDPSEADDHSVELPVGLELDEQFEYAASAFELMGWKQFGRLSVFVGHAAETANNPFDSSLDCGACAAHPGGPSARVLATICNREPVRERLEERGIEIPDDTVFLAGEHNTTTDEIELFADGVPESHREDLERLRRDLDAARAGAAAERAESMRTDPDDPVRETERRAADWSETRPEWGLAGNAAFVIGSRAWTEDLDLDGRSFLHSYDWETDGEGDALEAIMTGPMVVTQWINMQYYFATVDPAVYGSDTKITQNPVGNIGVFQGNGGDIMSGLPTQSVRASDDEIFHEPIRLTTVIRSPVGRVEEVIDEHEQVADILDNRWLSLVVVDPTRDEQPFQYQGGKRWSPAPEGRADTEQTASPAVSRTPEPAGAE